MDDGRPYLLLDEVRAGWRWTRGYVENVAAAVVRAATDKRAIGRVYNIGEEEPLTEREWVGSIARAADWNGDVVILPPGILPENLSRPLRWEQSQWADTSRLRKELDFVDPLPRSEAMKRTVEWERSNPPEQFDPNQFDYALEDSIRSQ
jgi:nucleoside-diphosphate-sugar epimerase